ncbi:MAG TPA: asparaginase [Candidatus Binatia bacterium]|nr:asparaginase [Candidatus Binatia bacterium]
MTKRPRIALVATGGTIDALGADRLDLAFYLETGRRLGPGELLARIPEVAGIAEVVEVPFRPRPSHAFRDADLLELWRTVDGAFADGADGVVVTHGTNTLEETAYFLHLTARTERPIVLTGAMRPASAVSSDGDLNLLNAIRVAADPGAIGLGTLVLLDDRIWSAREVTKGSTFRTDAFVARDTGPLGVADADGRVVWFHRPVRGRAAGAPPPFDVRGLDALPRVDVAVSYVGADGTAVDAFVAAGARGIVSAATGAGYPTPSEAAALERATAAGVVVVIASRVGAGRVARSPSMAARGWVAAGDLVPWKARLLLSLALTRSADPDEIQTWFDEL